ncbi:MAG: ribosome biogenesis GTPase Der [Fidelibacterota bacterium]
MNRTPIIAIVGRPNVGKSTFFNRMLSTRKAIVAPMEGITRDRIYGTMDWTGIKLTFIDTGGYIPEDVDIFNAATRHQAQMAIAEADFILLMVDGRVDPTASDKTLAQFVRESGKPHLLVVNKCDAAAQDAFQFRFAELGFDTVVPISSLTGRSTGDLLDKIVTRLELAPGNPDDELDQTMALAIVGMPNVGKSSIINALLQKEQTMVTPIAGTTRDSIDTSLRWYGKDITLIDTAGLRKKARVSDAIEYYSSVRTVQSIERAHVVLVVIDAEKGFGKQDKTILDQVVSKGKGLVILVNKWDLIEKDNSTMSTFKREMASQFKSLNRYPILFISAQTRQRISKILDVVWTVYQRTLKKLPTAVLNDWLQAAIQSYPPPAVRGKLIRMKYITQVSLRPSILAIYCNYPNLVPKSYQRYLENQLYDHMDLAGVPVMLSFRKK